MNQNLNSNAAKIAQKMIDDSENLNIRHFETESGTTIIDCGVKAEGSYRAGILFARACMGDLAEISIGTMDVDGLSLKKVEVKTDHPAVSCLSSQKAGWSIKGEKFFALGSGPARILAGKPKETIEKVGYREKADTTVLALEAGRYPPEEVCNSIAGACNVDPQNLYILIARTASPASTVQISARMVETCLYKMDHLGYDVNAVKKAEGQAPIAPIVGDDNLMMGITNDMIIYGSTVSIYSDMEIDVGNIPSDTSDAYGKPFAQIFKEAGYDFYKINPAIFAPAKVRFNNTKTNQVKTAGRVNPELIRKSIVLYTKNAQEHI